jgi:hypothetical protein
MYIKPRVLVIDETEYWDAELVEKAGGAIYGIYLYNENIHWHLCEFTPSYELHALQAVIRVYDENNDEVEQEVQQAWAVSTNPVDYMHVQDVKNVTNLPTQRCKADEYDEAWEGIMEYYRCNEPPFTLPPYPNALEE